MLKVSRAQQTQMCRMNQCYRRDQLPGTGHGYLRFDGGRAVCAGLLPKLNPDAPQVILVGEGLLREKWARILCTQNMPIEVYLKERPNCWEYVGKFEVERWSEAADEIRRHEARARRDDVVRVIYLRKIRI
jgi:hypothetical protein